MGVHVLSSTREIVQLCLLLLQLCVALLELGKRGEVRLAACFQRRKLLLARAQTLGDCGNGLHSIDAARCRGSIRDHRAAFAKSERV